MKPYTVKYKEYEAAKVEYEVVLANTARDAYLRFMGNHKWSIYSAWVDNVTYNNGNVHYFNNFSGKAY